MSQKLLALTLIFLGEICLVYAEIVGAHEHGIGTQTFLSVFIKMFPITIIGGGLLIAGYITGYRAFQNIWIVSVISITSILLEEPLISWITFHQLPTRGGWLGLAFGVAGLGSALFI